jgi:PAS domain-containing protein
MNGNSVVEMTGDAAFAVNAEGRITAWNEAAEQSLGYRCSEVVGRRCWNVVGGRNLSCNRDCARSCPFIELQSEPIHPAQCVFGLIDRTDMLLRDASGEPTRIDMSTFLVGAAGKREIVHLL